MPRDIPVVLVPATVDCQPPEVHIIFGMVHPATGGACMTGPGHPGNTEVFVPIFGCPVQTDNDAAQISPQAMFIVGTVVSACDLGLGPGIPVMGADDIHPKILMFFFMEIDTFFLKLQCPGQG